jgi:pimeloyl-ACP methyl ester carboxylesterase
MSEQLARVGDVELAYDTIGDPTDPTVLMVMGLGMQLVGWHPELCAMIAERGFQVVRFDNRDTGHSTKFEDGSGPGTLNLLLGRAPNAPYTIDDMAGDAVGLLDHLGIDQAHVVGASMGGAIAQTIAILRPERVLSLCSIMSTPGGRRASRPRMRGFGVMFRKAPEEREAFIEYTLGVVRTIGSPGFPFDEERIRQRAAESYDRCYYPPGVQRQLGALLASGDRSRRLAEVRAPTIVLHGTEDPLIPPRGGRATARAIPGAELVEIEGMGHDLPREVWPRLVDAIARGAERAGAEERSAAWR